MRVPFCSGNHGGLWQIDAVYEQNKLEYIHFEDLVHAPWWSKRTMPVASTHASSSEPPSDVLFKGHLFYYMQNIVYYCLLLQYPSYHYPEIADYLFPFARRTSILPRRIFFLLLSNEFFVQEKLKIAQCFRWWAFVPFHAMNNRILIEVVNGFLKTNVRLTLVHRRVVQRLKLCCRLIYILRFDHSLWWRSVTEMRSPAE